VAGGDVSGGGDVVGGTMGGTVAVGPTVDGGGKKGIAGVVVAVEERE
jgi:hypothetical protein